MSTADHDPVVVVENVCFDFGTTRALDQVSLSVTAGELFGLVGPDGAGKSTLFRILVSLIEPASGTVQVLGIDPVRDLWALRRQVGYMPGRFALYADLTVQENLEFFAAVFSTTVEAEYDTIAPIFRQIERFADRRAGALSGGMKQKLALCCALVHRPAILFLDEPTTGVDAVSRREFWDLLGTLRANGLTTIVSTPYMDEAMRCDRVALVQNGRVLAIDAPARLGGRFPRPLFGVRTRDRRRVLELLRTLPMVVSVFPFGDTVHVSMESVMANGGTLDHAALAEYLRTCVHAAGVVDATVNAIDAGIEDVFMELMGTETVGAAA